MKIEDKMKLLMALCKQRGIVFPGSEIYGGLANSWDYGPLGVELKNNIKKQWWFDFVHRREDMVGQDAAILMHPKTWEASGHLKAFNDPLTDCKQCKSRYRADDLITTKVGIDVEGKTLEEMTAIIVEKGIACPNCGSKTFTDVRIFNLMFKTFQGIIEDQSNTIYLRPETAQSIFINFANAQRSSRKKLPFGIAQIGKAFRNEITPGNFIFRTREFEQMEIEYFVQPEEAPTHFESWMNSCMEWFIKLGVKKENLRFYEHPKEKLSHYSDRTVDIEYNYPFGGFKELMGIANRTNFDLKQHMEYSGEDLKYYDQESNTHVIPYVIEPSFGLDRSLLVFLLDAFEEEVLSDGKTRSVLHLDHRLAPIKVAILPLAKNQPRIVQKARDIFNTLIYRFHVVYDDSGSIGKLYRRQDEIGTPFCITVDFETVDKDDQVTIRERDSMTQERIPVKDLEAYFNKKLILS